ncbi:MAG: malate dehydrogenase, partial [Acidimicrobiia bacterium]|nr:malate dehydrogenase [Acidimicrobiia bacterium]
VPEGLCSSFPCVSREGRWEIVPGLEHSDFSRERIQASVDELVAERDTVVEMGFV